MGFGESDRYNVAFEPACIQVCEGGQCLVAESIAFINAALPYTSVPVSKCLASVPAAGIN